MSRYDFHFVSLIIARAEDRLQAFGNVNVRIVRTSACDEQAALTDVIMWLLGEAVVTADC